jgi:hypothetical protein
LEVLGVELGACCLLRMCSILWYILPALLHYF